jgi:hypothetical protein
MFFYLRVMQCHILTPHREYNVYDDKIMSSKIKNRKKEKKEEQK